MFLEPNANLPAIAKQFSCTIFFGDPDIMLPSFVAYPRTLVFEKDAKKAGITIDLAQELVRLNTALPASTPDRPNFLVVKNAELLNENASNALLKTFEESRQHFVLLARPNVTLLPTIISRSAIFYLPTSRQPSPESIRLAQTKNIPELANALDKKPDLALEVLNLIAEDLVANGGQSLKIDQLNSIARAVTSGNSIKLAFLSYL